MKTENAMVSLAVRMVSGSMPRTALADGAVRFVDRNFSRWLSESNNMMQFEQVARAAIREWLVGEALVGEAAQPTVVV